MNSFGNIYRHRAYVCRLFPKWREQNFFNTISNGSTNTPSGWWCPSVFVCWCQRARQFFNNYCHRYVQVFSLRHNSIAFMVRQCITPVITMVFGFEKCSPLARRPTVYSGPADAPGGVVCVVASSLSRHHEYGHSPMFRYNRWMSTFSFLSWEDASIHCINVSLQVWHYIIINRERRSLINMANSCFSLYNIRGGCVSVLCNSSMCILSYYLLCNYIQWF